jgi:hypothetical protein
MLTGNANVNELHLYPDTSPVLSEMLTIQGKYTGTVKLRVSGIANGLDVGTAINADLSEATITTTSSSVKGLAAHGSDLILLGTDSAVLMEGSTLVATYGDLAAAVEAYSDPSQIIILFADHNEDLTLSKNVCVDLNGYDITGNLTVDGTLTVFDSATDDYTVADGFCGEITGTVTGALVAKDGYVAAANGFHKVDQYISSVSLRTSQAGVYYSATFLCDEVLAQEIETQGVAVSLTDLPGADFETDEDTLYAIGNHGVMVANILKGDADDADRAIMDIYAASFIKLKDGTVLTSTAEVAYSLYDVLMLIKDHAPDAFESFVEKWQ